jgi:hypothetical protein
MAVSKCMKCDNTTFESVACKMSNQKVEFTFVQCAKCGGVVGVIDTASLKLVGNAILGQLQSPPLR